MKIDFSAPELSMLIKAIDQANHSMGIGVPVPKKVRNLRKKLEKNLKAAEDEASRLPIS